MITFLLVGIGGFFGSILRYGTSIIFQSKISNGLIFGIPMATLTVNLVGSLFIGILLSLDNKLLSNNSYLLIVTGLLGGFTTYSAFSGEVIMLFKNQQIIYGLFYIALTLILGLLLTATGFYLGRLIIFK